MNNRTSIFVDIFDIKARSFCLLVASLLLTTILFGSNCIIGRDTIVMDSDAIEIRSDRITFNDGSIPESDHPSGDKQRYLNRVKIEKEA